MLVVKLKWIERLFAQLNVPQEALGEKSRLARPLDVDAEAEEEDETYASLSLLA